MYVPNIMGAGRVMAGDEIASDTSCSKYGLEGPRWNLCSSS